MLRMARMHMDMKIPLLPGDTTTRSLLTYLPTTKLTYLPTTKLTYLPTSSGLNNYHP